ncbi:DUF3572 family protein [Amaricoccus solimangrovi]|uniref:DUF3572 family protein n=2 Tax=Amaricoccus solimangrovi TaxID=2589815 RepID=A0A501WSK9_9RHOB|nr:DUF3572 family protein [Amaricoccus solimangrovi]
MGRDGAIDLARSALIWLAGEPEALGAFLGASGLDPAALRARVEDPEFLGFVLDFLLGDEAMLLAFCGQTGTAPAAPARARALLPGGDLPNWT